MILPIKLNCEATTSQGNVLQRNWPTRCCCHWFFNFYCRKIINEEWPLTENRGSTNIYLVMRQLSTRDILNPKIIQPKRMCSPLLGWWADVVYINHHSYNLFCTHIFRSFVAEKSVICLMLVHKISLTRSIQHFAWYATYEMFSYHQWLINNK